MAIEFVGCQPSDRLHAYAYYRVAVRVLGFVIGDAWVENNLKDVYGHVASVCPLVPTIPYSRAPGDKSLVIDCKAAANGPNVSVAQAAGAINGIALAVEVVSVEMLGSAAEVDHGAPARAALVQSVDAQRGTIADALGVGGVTDTVKWVMIAVVAVVLVVVIKDAEEWI